MDVRLDKRVAETMDRLDTGGRGKMTDGGLIEGIEIEVVVMETDETMMIKLIRIFMHDDDDDDDVVVVVY